MPKMLNALLQEAGVPLADVRLIRHKDNKSKTGRSPYDLWLKNPDQFEVYQSTQRISNRTKLNSNFWAVFVVNPLNETVFAGLYAVKYKGLLEQDLPIPNLDGVDSAGSCDVYDLTLLDVLSDQIGKLIIDWGTGYRAWVQHAKRKNKQIIESKSSV